MDSTSWLKSPLTEQTQRLRPPQQIVLRPYHGAKKRLRLFRTDYLIGSGADCDIRLDDPFVSPHHARLQLFEQSGYVIEDIGSRNGVFLNGVRVQSAPLPAQGTLRLGRSSCSWSEEKEPDLETGDWVVADPGMREILARLKRWSASSLPVLLLGETGTGKELLARLVHEWSARAKGPYVVVNGAHTAGTLADSELFGHKKGAFTGAESSRLGALRSANGGTLFLDEVADVPLAAQVKLLRALEAGEVKALGSDTIETSDFRLVAATSQSIEDRLANASLRLDLYYRLAGFVVKIPPLRERPLDIRALAKHYAEERGMEIDAEAEAKLLSYSWPGNVRELRAILERALLLARAEKCARILESHIDVGTPMKLPTIDRPPMRKLRELERSHIQHSLERNGWSRTVSAQELGISRSTLLSKMKRFGIRDGASLDH